MLKSVKQLELAGADFIVLPCNTLHSLLPELRKNSKIKIFDLIEEVSARIKKDYCKIGILSTTKTRTEGLYDKHLEGGEIVYPNEEEQKEVSEIIIRIIRKIASVNDKKYLEKVIENMREKGAEKVVLACTDIGNLIGNNLHTLDSTQVLIDSIIARMLE